MKIIGDILKSNDSDIFAFVLMPFDKAFDDIYKLGIKETATSLGIKAERVDEQMYMERILERIYRQIKTADLIIADMSGQNPNVFYEVGYAHAMDKLCVLITNNTEDIPFDLKHHRHIVYGSSIDGLRTNLAEELAWAKNEITNVRSSKIKVQLKNVYGTLEKTKYIAKGVVEIKFDFLNESSSSSADLEAIYFYSGKGWTLYQDDKECPSTDSDLPDLTTRHFLNPPIRKLHKNSWAQLKFKASKILAFKVSGDEFKDSYHVSGRSVIRLVTSDGHFDYEIPLDVNIDEIPF